MKKSLFIGKGSRTTVFTAITVVGVILLLLLNLLITNLGISKMLFIDMTPEGLYTLSDNMEKICDELMDGVPEGKTIRFTFCSDPDTLIGALYTRIPYYLALGLSLRYDNVEVVEYNVTYNPTAVSMYKTTSRSEIEPSDMIISYGSKYRVINCESLWTATESTNEFYSFNGEYKVASAIASLTAINLPKAYFVTDHGTSYYDPQSPDSEMSIENATFADLLTELGMEIKHLELSAVDAIPDDCAMLIINLPTKDFMPNEDEYNNLSYVSDLEKLDRYLVDGGGTLIVNKSYEHKLKNFEIFLNDWGIAFSNSYVIDTENAIGDGDGRELVAEYDDDDQSYGYNFYGDYIGLASAPKTVFFDTGYLYCSWGDGDSRREPGYKNVTRRYAPFIGTFESATANTADGVVESEAGYKTLAAISARSNLDQYSGENTYSFIFATASPEFYSNEVLGNPSFANYDLVLDVFINISRTDRYVSTDLGGLSQNSLNFGGKKLTDTSLSTDTRTFYSNDYKKANTYLGFSTGNATFYTVLVLLPAGAAIVLGAVIFIKRKFL